MDIQVGRQRRLATHACMGRRQQSCCLVSSVGCGLSFQGIVLPQILTGVAANLVNAVINYLFIYQLYLGVM